MEKFTTTEGREIMLLPVSYIRLQSIDLQVEKEFKDRGEQVNVPQYIAETIGGVTERHDHDEESIKTASEEDKAAWDAHIDCRARMTAEATKRRNQYIFLKGIDIDRNDALEGNWIKEAEYFGFAPPPEDEKERMMQYVETELLKTPQDQLGVTTRIIRLSMEGVPDDTLDAAEATFRALLAGQVPAEDEDSGGKVDETEGVLDDEPNMESS
jgi:hypothetical protein